MKNLILGLIISLIFIGCEFIFNQCKTPYYLFEVDFTISPEGNLYSVGDTIKMSSIIGPYVEDQKTGELIDCGETFLFPLDFSVIEFDSLEVISHNYDFDEVELIGTVDTFAYAGGALTLLYQLDENTLSRYLEFFIIPRKTGLFTIEFSYFTPYYQEGFLSSDDDCEEEATLVFNINNKVGLGYELVEPSGYFSSKEEYEEFGYFYSFEVVE